MNYFIYEILLYMKFNFLVADPCEINRHILRNMLNKKFPYSNIHEVTDYSQLLSEILKEYFDFIFVDTQICDVNETFYSILKHQGNQKSIITTTTHGDNESIADFFQYGTDDVLVKPFKAKTLSKTIIRQNSKKDCFATQQVLID